MTCGRRSEKGLIDGEFSYYGDHVKDEHSQRDLNSIFVGLGLHEMSRERDCVQIHIYRYGIYYVYPRWIN